MRFLHALTFRLFVGSCLLLFSLFALCSNEARYAHPPDRTVLGVLDARMSLEKVDVSIAKAKRTFILYALAITVEKLAFPGELSATVAQELNNPLERILTHAKLNSKRLHEPRIEPVGALTSQSTD